jgi:hypothetical protein
MVDFKEITTFSALMAQLSKVHFKPILSPKSGFSVKKEEIKAPAKQISNAKSTTSKKKRTQTIKERKIRK